MSLALSEKNALQIDMKQSQQQHLTLKQRQGLDLLFLSRQELESKLTEALLTNPLIEMEEFSEEPYELQEFPEEAPGKTEDESLYEAQAYENSEDWVDELPLPAIEKNTPREDFLLYTPAPEQRLRDDLMADLNLCKNLSPQIREIAENMILYLDDDGFLRTPLEDIAMTCSCSMADALEGLETIQQLDPPGVGARSVQECFLLQLKRKGEWSELYEKLLTDELENLKRNRLDIVCQNLGTNMETLEQMFLKIRKLKTAPVTVESRENPVIQPEVEIRRNSDGTFSAELLKERRSFKLSDDAKLVNAPDAGADFVQKVKEGENLLEALEFRKSTILRMAEMLIALQGPFLESGPEKLRPMTMKQAADFLNFKSESTISRAAASKYVKTPHGVLPFKYFFTSGYTSEEGAQVSRTADMELLKKLVDEEDKKHPLSDEKLSQLLNEAGHPVARRTVVKYREKMNIPNSSLRKEHF